MEVNYAIRDGRDGGGQRYEEKKFRNNNSFNPDKSSGGLPNGYLEGIVILIKKKEKHQRFSWNHFQISKWI
jgi:hypothetical protein